MVLMDQVHELIRHHRDQRKDFLQVALPNGFKATLPSRDLEDLMTPHSLVADNVLNAYLHLLESQSGEYWHIFDPVFYTNSLGPKVPYNFAECFRTSGFMKLAPASVQFKKILFPCNTGLHWVLVIYDFEFTSISYFDSLWPRYPQINNVRANSDPRLSPAD